MGGSRTLPAVCCLHGGSRILPTVCWLHISKILPPTNIKRNFPLSDSDRGRFSLNICCFAGFLTTVQHGLPPACGATDTRGCTMECLPPWMSCFSGCGCASGRCHHRGWSCVLRAFAPASRLGPGCFFIESIVFAREATHPVHSPTHHIRQHLHCLLRT